VSGDPAPHCIEVTGSHICLIFNRKVYRTVASALALPELPTGDASSPGGHAGATARAAGLA
jgi:hypothetical protein